jgi:hypothetical protein
VGLGHNTSCCGVEDWENTCTCSHNHVNWDTNPVRECKYFSFNQAYGTGGNYLNFHYHYHHNWCG